MGVFYLKSRDTRPTLQVQLLNPDNTVHDLTGTTTYKLHIKAPSGTVSRDMIVVGALTNGTLAYSWVAADWDNLPLVTPNHQKDLQMEYEVIGPSTRLTFPNNGWDTLRIYGDIGQA